LVEKKPTEKEFAEETPEKKMVLLELKEKK
jgi:hypothetical protein